MEKITRRRGKVIVLMVFMIFSFFPVGVKAQWGGDSMMGQSMMRERMMPRMGMMEPERIVLPRMGLMGMLHRWGNYFFTKRDQLGITKTQLDNIESILNSQIKYEIRENANRKVLIIEIEELLVKDKVDLDEVERKVKLLEALTKEMTMEEIRTLNRALAILTPEQQVNMKALFRASTFSRAGVE